MLVSKHRTELILECVAFVFQMSNYSDKIAIVASSPPSFAERWTLKTPSRTTSPGDGWCRVGTRSRRFSAMLRMQLLLRMQPPTRLAAMIEQEEQVQQQDQRQLI